MKPHIPVEQCLRGHVYRVQARNIRVGVFAPDHRDGFIGIREKGWGRKLVAEHHFDGGPPSGTCKPLEDLGVLPHNVEPALYLGTLCRHCGISAKYDETKPRVVEGSKLPGTWVHLEPTSCEELRPTAINNDALFEFLDALEQRLGLGPKKFSLRDDEL